MQNTKKMSTYTLALVGMMAAAIFVANFVSFPVPSAGNTRIHIANAVCLLAGMLLGPINGGLAAGIGSALYDFTNPLFASEFWITFINKFMLTFVCGLVVHGLLGARRGGRPAPLLRVVLGAVLGSLVYIGLFYMKSYLMGKYLALANLVPSFINAAFGIVVAPLLYYALQQALARAGLYEKVTIH